MSVLKKIRENVGLVIVFIALSLFAFIFSSVYDNFGPKGDDTVGEVNGTSIAYPALEAKFELAQRNNPDATSTPEQYQLKEQAWQSLVREAFYSKEWTEAGIGISDDEIMMMFTGRIYHPYVIQSGYFADSLGRFDPSRVPMVLQRADEIDVNDPRIDPNWIKWKLGLIDLRNIISLDRRSSKWQAAIKGSALVSDNEMKWAYEQQQRAADISYLFVPYATIPDEQIQITDADRNEYYNKHREAYRLTDDLVRIKYTYFKIAPSSLDSSRTREELVKLRDEFRNSTEPFEFASSGSDERGIDTTAKPLAQLPEALRSLNGRTDTVVGPLMGVTGMQIMRIVKMEEDSVNSTVQLRHIAVNLRGYTKDDSTKAKAKADSLLKVVMADRTKFGEVAMAASDDQRSKEAGGDMGYRVDSSYKSMNGAFYTDLKAHKVGDIYVTTSNGAYNVVELQDRSNKLYSYAAITRIINAGSETNDSIFRRASLFHGDILSGGNMDSVTLKYPDARTLSSGNIGPSTYNLLGLIAGRPVVTWAFNNDQGAISQKIIETEDAFVVAKNEYKGTRGYASVESLKDNPEFEYAVRTWLKAKQIKAKLGNGGSDLQQMASNYGPGATTGQARDLHFASNEVPNLGNEPKVVGRAFGLQPGAMSAPLSGNAGVYVVKLDAIREPNPMDELNKMILTQTLKNSKAEGTINSLFQGMRENAEIIDMRYKAEF